MIRLSSNRHGRAAPPEADGGLSRQASEEATGVVQIQAVIGAIRLHAIDTPDLVGSVFEVSVTNLQPLDDRYAVEHAGVDLVLVRLASTKLSSGLINLRRD